jgi:hypothetical protein
VGKFGGSGEKVHPLILRRRPTEKAYSIGTRRQQAEQRRSRESILGMPQTHNIGQQTPTEKLNKQESPYDIPEIKSTIKISTKFTINSGEKGDMTKESEILQRKRDTA